MNANKVMGVEASAADAKANFKAKCVEVDGKLVWTFGNGSTATIDPQALSVEIQQAAMMHGLKQTISDAYSGIKLAGECYTFAQVRIDTLLGGEWSSRGKAGEGSSDLAQAVSNLTGKTIAECVQVLSAMEEGKRKEFAKKPQVAAELARIKAVRLAEVASKADNSLNDLFGGVL